ncbi:Type III restriction enzyme, res subunit:DEAD/DEAH box helicase [sediment metagenome]|uniref:Type III restriction enzyme, res subunit:DEAD/DEAH box helicase n=1 Tax=sediment metagenome TaxID=749907 RepID=D9PN00_9ZZZZ
MIPTPEQLAVYRSIFRGRDDCYARYWEKNGRSGYSPAYSLNWQEFKQHQASGGTMKDFSDKTLLPITDEAIFKHIVGNHAIGTYPILDDNTSYFIAADFDGKEWQNDAQAYVDACTILGLHAYLERSKSGNGGHVWIFFEEAYPCFKSRTIALSAIAKTFNYSVFEKEISFDHLFPNQDSLPSGGFGNLIALPLQGTYSQDGNSLFVDQATLIAYEDQWSFLSQIKRHSASDLDAVYKKITGSTQSIVKVRDKNNSNNEFVITVNNLITLNRSQLSQSIIEFLKEKLNFLNTEYLTRKRLGKSVYQVQKYFRLVEENGELVTLPRGFLEELISFLKENDIKYKVENEHPTFPKVSFTSNIVLRPEQGVLVDGVLPHTNGVIVAPPGSGKTMIGMELIAKHNLPALVLVHRKQLLDQWVDRIESHLGIPRTKIGTFSGTRKKLGKEITAALMQSFARNQNLNQFQDKFGTIIIDECHHIPAKTFRETITNFNPQYLYGLTATPKRKHNDEQLIYVYIGPVIAKMSEPETGKKNCGHLNITVTETDFSIPFSFKTDQYELLAKMICYDTVRNQLIKKDILEQTTAGARTLVLSERKEHLDVLELYLKGQCEIVKITGDDSSASRTSKLKQIQDGHYQVILSTGQFFGEGLDVQSINSLILAFPFSFEGKLIQYLGRLRQTNTNQAYTVCDYRDSQIPFLERQFKARNRHYKKLSTKV